MRFIIDGQEYGLDDIGNMSQQTIVDMPRQAGMGVQTWSRRAEQIARLALAEDGETVVVLSEREAKEHPERVDPNLLTESAPHVHAFVILVWLARRAHIGEGSLTYAASAAVPWKSVEFLPDEEDDETPVEVVEDPSLLSASAPVADSAEHPSMQPSPV